MSQLADDYKCGTLYGISAAELHERLVRDLDALCQHHGIECRAFENPDARPIEQTIRMVVMAFVEDTKDNVTW